MKLLYKTEELYVGELGYVSRKDKNNIKIDPSKVNNRFIIFKHVSLKLDTDRRYEFHQNFINYGIDIVTGKKYLLWSGNEYTALVKCCLSGYAICKYFPIEQVLTKPKEENNSKDNDKVTDNILNLILETNKKVQEMELSDEDKENITLELEILGEEYVNKMIELRENKNILMVDNEYSIQMEFIKRLVEIENQIEDKEIKEIGSLKRELRLFKKNLGE